ncbi:hypothetical protein C1H46_005819 [Malus baccata]|uniref:RING-CH-type domain-containing protein n=1 Tax=Malus baccata TaxID=106549 RepID=A0A540ND40_MALBA|nr:hypothetical protein C1H46_005819 [Malus baccata]
METASKMVEKAVAFASGKSSTKAKEKVEVLNKDIEVGQGSSNVNSEEGKGSGIRIQNECRICQDEDYLHRLEAPCCCNGTLKVRCSTNEARVISLSLPSLNLCIVF